MTDIADAVADALHGVYDPCSVSAGASLSIVDMGLLTSVEVDHAGVVVIGLRTTSPACMLAGNIAAAAEASALRVPGVSDVRVEVDTTQGWSEADLSEEGRRRLEARRERSRREVPVTPQEWRHRGRRVEAG